MKLFGIKLHCVGFYLVVAAFFAVSLLKPINLTNQDIGRHLINGREVISQQWSVLSTNYYSFSKTQKSMVNHHWLSGVVFFLIKQAWGFAGLHLFHIGIYFLAFFLFLLLIRKKSGSDWIAAAAGVFSAMLLSSRAEIRPETFGYLFLIHTLWQLTLIASSKQIKTWQILILVIQQVLWVNLHLSFVFSIFVFTLAWISSLLKLRPLHQIKHRLLLWVMLSLILASTLNPNFLTGLFQPFSIFTDYGYSIIENKDLLYLYRVIKVPMIFYWALTASVYFCLLTLHLIKAEKPTYDSMLAGAGIILGFIALRNIPLMVIFTFPYLAKRLFQEFKQLKIKVENPKTAKTLLSLLLLLFAAGPNLYLKNSSRSLQLGLLSGQNQAAKYLKNHPPQAPIFNNYDIGSYLIYHLYPEYKVFVDNRPEAYGRQFFQEIYIPLQSSEKKWQELQAEYQFETLIIGTKDITPWNRGFVKRRLKDPNWKTDFQDEFCLIMSKK